MNDDAGNPLVLSGYTANSLIKRWYTSTNSIAFGTSINVASGTITLSLDANTSSRLCYDRYVYDVVITNGTTTSRPVEGFVIVKPAVTNSR